ncbi:MAG: restriction endonuclease subunit S, partial [Dysgonamonadaceae bacterium]|nr:restriction endonuclease subunit S [Dysgonamonadaceae bacterium]
MKVSELFSLKQGNSFELMNMTKSNTSTVNFVSRASTNNGVTGIVDEIQSYSPFSAGLLTVALSGNGVLSTFVQTKPFYTGFHVMVMEPKRSMSFNEKLFYAMCIKSNAYRYAWGRQANKTLRILQVPDTTPQWVNNQKIIPVKSSVEEITLSLNIDQWREFELSGKNGLFNIERGTRLTKENRLPGEIPLVTAGFQNQGIAEMIYNEENKLYSN